MNPLEQLLKELGELLHMALKPDEHHTCLIDFPEEQVQVQLELDDPSEHLLLGSMLGGLTPGLYRERVLQEALCTNGRQQAVGILAYSEKAENLVLFEYLPLTGLDGAKLLVYLERFLTHASAWRAALAKNEIPSIGTARA